MVERINKKHAVFALGPCIACITACIVIDLSLAYGLLGACIYTFVFFMKKGFEVKYLIKRVIKGVGECSSIFIIIALMGSTIAIWMSSGVVPSLVYYGFEYIGSINFLLACFIATALAAMFMGTALGTVSTIGVALLAIGSGIGISKPVLVGAILSGAFLADRLSPISGLVNLTLKSTDTAYKNYFKTDIKAALPVLLITALAYGLLGSGYTASVGTEVILAYQSSIQEAFFISPFMLLFPLLIIGLAVLGIKTIPNMVVSALGGICLSILLQEMGVADVIKTILYGYKPVESAQLLSTIVKGGGIFPMLEVMIIVAGAVALNSILECTGVIEVLIKDTVKKAASRNGLIFRSALLSIGFTAVTCDQTVGIIVMGRFFKKRFIDFGMSQEQLASTIAGTGTSIAPLFPWNVNSIIIMAITGVMTWQYAPFAVLCYISPIVAMLAGMGIQQDLSASKSV